MHIERNEKYRSIRETEEGVSAGGVINGGISAVRVTHRVYASSAKQESLHTNVCTNTKEAINVYKKSNQKMEANHIDNTT